MLERRIHPDDAGQRLDRLLRKLLPGATLGQVFRLLRRGAVRLDGQRARAGDRRVAAGELLQVRVDPARVRVEPMAGLPRPAVVRPAAARVLYRDQDLLAVDKPAGLAVHGGRGHRADNLVARVAGLSPPAEGAVFRPAPAHRLDAATSGIVLFGLSGAGLRGLTAQLRARTVHKHYRALVSGPLPAAAGTIDLALRVGDAAAGGAKTVVDGSAGRPALTRYRQLAVRGDLRLLELEAATGRTHQLRAHLAALGCPIVGDRRYGGRPAPRLMLHAHRLALVHPVSGEPVDLEAPLPAELRAPGE